jgi:hypothetical protein
LGDLQRLISTTSGEIKSIGEQLQRNAQNVITDLDRVFKDRLDQLIGGLNESERRMVEDAQALVYQMQVAARELTVKVAENAREALYEADITAYNALTGSSLSCRTQEPRFVYVRPNALRAGLDRPEITIRGNYLKFGDANVKVEETRATVIANNANEIVLRIPESVINSVTVERSLRVTGTPLRCEPGTFSYQTKPSLEELSVPIVVKPPASYSINVIIVPIIRLPTTQLFVWDFYDSDKDCRADRPADRNWCVLEGWQIAPATIDVKTTEATCDSGITETPQLSGSRCISVRGRIKGCGVKWMMCKGRGSWRYRVSTDAKTYGQRPFRAHEQRIAISDSSQRVFSIDYPHQIPTDNQGVIWTYNVAVQVKRGNQARRVDLSETNPNAEGVTTRIGNQGKLAVELGPGIDILTVNN